MKYIIIFLLATLIYFGCAPNYEEIPILVKENNLEKEYNEAKWFVYSRSFFEDGIIFKCDTCKYDLVDFNLNIISCGLKLYNLKVQKDTTIFNFYFYLKDTNRICYPLYEFYVSTVIFLKGDSIPFVTQSWVNLKQSYFEEMRLFEAGKVRYDLNVYTFIESQKKFKDFLRTTKHPINDWLKKEAKKRGFLP